MTLAFASPDDYRRAIADLPLADKGAIQKAQERQKQLTKPHGSLGRLEELALWMASWQSTEKPQINTPSCLIFAGNHGVASLGVSAFPPEVTAQMVANFAAGGAAINQLTAVAGASLEVIPLLLDTPTHDFTQRPAMDMDETLDAMSQGTSAIPHDTDVLLLGEMGIANSTVAAAIALATLGGNAQDWVGAGTGVDADGIKLKAEIITKAININKNALSDGLSIISAIGGRELAAIAGAVLAARHQRIPVLLDGFISTAAALPLLMDNPAAWEHCQISHLSQEPGHLRIIQKTNKIPILDLGLRLGEASGAATALPILKAAVATHSHMATFTQAGVSDK